MELGIGEWIVIIVSAVILAWFFIGNALNNQLAQKLLTWLVASAKNIGKVTTGRMLAPTSEGLRAMIKLDESPIRQMEVLLRLLRRENLPLWLYQLILGKQDTVTLNISLQKASQSEIAVFLKKNSTREVELANRGKKQALVFIQETTSHRIYYRHQMDSDQVQRVIAYLDKEPALIMLILTSENPRLKISLPLRSFDPGSQAGFFVELTNLA